MDERMVRADGPANDAMTAVEPAFGTPPTPAAGNRLSVSGLDMDNEIHGTTHVTLADRADWLLSMISAFLDAPMPEQKNAGDYIAP